MKRSDNSTMPRVVRWSLVAGLAVSCAPAFAAGSAEVAPAVAAQASPAASAASAKGQQTLMIQSPSGGAVRLTYVPDQGWQADRAASVAMQGSGRVSTVSAPQSDADPELDETSRKPMTVFIDGPTGYTYFWSKERGWKFVGRLTDRFQ